MMAVWMVVLWVVYWVEWKVEKTVVRWELHLGVELVAMWAVMKVGSMVV